LNCQSPPEREFAKNRMKLPLQTLPRRPGAQAQEHARQVQCQQGHGCPGALGIPARSVLIIEGFVLVPLTRQE
jgi:hypothetical protein